MNKVFKDCRCEVLYFDGRAVDNETRDVRISATELVVSFDDDQGQVVYRGKNNNNGHFHIKDGSGGSATLHQTPGELILEGSWKTIDDRGMLKITLPDDVESENPRISKPGFVLKYK